MLDIEKSWDKIAHLYRKRYLIKSETVHYGPLCPGEDKLCLLGDVTGLRAIDLGCGAGQNAIALAKSGADVTAVDFSSNQLAEAESLARDEGVHIEFVNGDVTDLSFVVDNTFDLAISACTMAFVGDIKAAFLETYRILKTGGIFALSVMHPVQYILDGDKGHMYFNSSFPFSPRLLKWSWDFDGISVKFQNHLRSIADYHNTLTDAGFEVKKLLEPKPTLKTPHLGFSREIMCEYPYIANHLPVTLIFVAVKPSLYKRGKDHG
jgi:ubiquinone/menaquinone biosynthesis C-methylase UbiE